MVEAISVVTEKQLSARIRSILLCLKQGTFATRMNVKKYGGKDKDGRRESSVCPTCTGVRSPPAVVQGEQEAHCKVVTSPEALVRR